MFIIETKVKLMQITIQELNSKLKALEPNHVWSYDRMSFVRHIYSMYLMGTKMWYIWKPRGINLGDD